MGSLLPQGIELDILTASKTGTGHPEHDILFIATQVARAAGLKFPSAAVSHYKRDYKVPALALKNILETLPKSQGLPVGPNGRAYHPSTNLMSEAHTYQMLLRGRAPASEPFRKWVTEEVLPSIRKTGSYNVNESVTKASCAGKEGIQFSWTLSGTAFTVSPPQGNPSTAPSLGYNAKQRQRNVKQAILKSIHRSFTYACYIHYLP